MDCELSTLESWLTSSWRRPQGVDFLGGVEVVEIIKATNDELEYIVAPKHVATRGDTLNCMSIRCVELIGSGTIDGQHHLAYGRCPESHLGTSSWTG